MRITLITVVAMSLGSCDRDAADHEARPDAAATRAPRVAGPAPAAPAPAAPAQTAPAPPPPDAPHWSLRPDAGGAALVLQAPAGAPAVTVSCEPGRSRLHIWVSGFTPIASEDRLSFGSGGAVEAFAAQLAGPGRPPRGVAASGAIPADLPRLLARPIAASYGAQTSGPHPAVPAPLAARFAAACRAAPAQPAPAPAPSATATATAPGACFVQDGARLPPLRWHALGTEPFWAARIEGRCVTYSHPEDQRGTRLWTRYAPAPGGGEWTGALGTRAFRLRTRAAPGCSDGMSDTVYPVAAELVLGGERRTGCAKPM